MYRECHEENLVIVPTFNEAENIEELIPTVMGLDRPFDMLVVDDNSPDGTAGLVEAYNQNFWVVYTFSNVPTRRAWVLPIWRPLMGIDRDYDFIFEMDADFSHDPYDLLKLQETLQTMMQMLWWVLVMYAGFRLSTGLYPYLLSYFASCMSFDNKNATKRHDGWFCGL